MKKLAERDRKYLWHPLTQHKLSPEHLAIEKANGVWLTDESGKKYIDGISSWYTCMYGHCNSYITSRVKDQLDQLDHVVFSGFTHETAIELSESLMEILPKNQAKIFFSDNGSTSVDIAIKMSLQYFFNKQQKKTKVIALEDAFHGDTFGAMSVSGLSVYNGPFEDFLLTIDRIPVPTKDNFAEVKDQFVKLLANNDVAAFIYEPLVQGAAAMKMYASEYLDELMKIAQDSGVLTIADEVMTGFGKTGKYFASDWTKHKPDIMCLSKSLTGGVTPMAVTTCTQDIYNAFYSDELSKGFFHGHTYSANPVSCSAAIASIELLKTNEIQRAIENIYQWHLDFEQKVAKHRNVASTRVLGVIFALDLNIEMDRYGQQRNQMFQFFMDRGVFLRPLGNTIYILAPFITSETEMNQIYTVILEYLDCL